MRKSLLLAAFALLLTLAGPARAQFCPGASPWVFDDVPASDLFCGYITWAAENGITLGCAIIDANHRLYCPASLVTRSEMAALVNRLGNIRVEAVDTGPGLIGGPITSIGTISLAATQLLPTVACANGQIPQWTGTAWTCANPAGGGTVTSVASGTGLAGGPVTTSGTLSIATAFQLPQGCANGQVAKSNGSGAWTCAADSNSGGTVTQVNTGTGLTGGPITTTGTVSIANGGVGTAQLADGSVNLAKLVTASTDLRYYKQGGNAFGATAVLGTTDNNALDLHVNGARAMRYEANAISPNVVGGHPSNNVTPGVRGATIAGGGVAIGDTDPNFTGEAANRVTDAYGTVGGGYGNVAGDDASTAIDRPFATVAGGQANRARGARSIVGGGENNVTINGHSAIVGGLDNQAVASYSFIGAGSQNVTLVGGGFSVIGGGDKNTTDGAWSTVGGGVQNSATGERSVVAGGAFNVASGLRGAVLGGQGNTASNNSATVIGGQANQATGLASTVSGGISNKASGDYSWAAGRAAITELNASTVHHGAFVWADNNPTGITFRSTAANEFSARATGGVRFVTAINGSGVPTAGVSLAAGDSAWAVISDRQAKENWIDVDARQVLERVASLPIGEWNYKAQGPHVRHIGPAAQDFHAAFGLGHSDRVITTVDADGVALAAIKGANEKIEAQAREIADLRTRIAEIDILRAELRAMRQLIVSGIAP